MQSQPNDIEVDAREIAAARLFDAAIDAAALAACPTGNDPDIEVVRALLQSRHDLADLRAELESLKVEHKGSTSVAERCDRVLSRRIEHEDQSVREKLADWWPGCRRIRAPH